jgi:hypothetical protein
MWRPKIPLAITALYILCIVLAIIANQRGSDPEGIIAGQVVLALPWDLVFAPLLNTQYGVYVYALCMVLNATTLYVIVAWAASRRKSK